MLLKYSNRADSRHLWALKLAPSLLQTTTSCREGSIDRSRIGRSPRALRKPSKLPSFNITIPSSYLDILVYQFTDHYDNIVQKNIALVYFKHFKSRFRTPSSSPLPKSSLKHDPKTCETFYKLRKSCLQYFKMVLMFIKSWTHLMILHVFLFLYISTFQGIILINLQS